MKSSRKSIVIYADALDNQSAGVHQYVRNFLLALDQSESRFDFHLLRMRDEAPQFERIRSHVLPGTNRFVHRAQRIFHTLPRAARRLHADAVMEFTNFGPWRIPAQIHRLLFIHDLSAVHYPQYHHWHAAKLQQWCLPRLTRKASLIYANSHYTARDIQEYYQLEQAPTVLYPGKDYDYYPDERPPVSIDSQRYEYILSVGTLEPRKNLSTLIQAFHRLKERGWLGKLVLTGGAGWKQKAIEKDIIQSPHQIDIISTGYVPKPELRRLYSHCSCFAYPSYFEGFGLPILEAIMCGARVVASPSSSMPEVGGDIARYADPHSVDEWTDQIHAALNATPPQSNDIKKHIARFDWDESIGIFLTSLDRLFYND